MYTFVETKLFTRLIEEYLTDEEYAALQPYLAANPESGGVIEDSGGGRELRWSVAGRGKSGRIRVNYYLKSRAGQIWLLTVYARNVRESIPAAVLKNIEEELDGTYQAQFGCGNSGRAARDRARCTWSCDGGAGCIRYSRTHGAFAVAGRTAPWRFGSGANTYWSTAMLTTYRRCDCAGRAQYAR